MAELPNTNNGLTDGDTTESEFQTDMNSVVDFLRQLAISGEPENVTLLLGTVAPTKAHIIVDTENDTVEDDLNNITPTGVGEKLLFVQSTDSSRVVVLKHNKSGSGKLILQDELDVTLSSPSQFMVFNYDPDEQAWVELLRNFGLFLPDPDLVAAAIEQLGITNLAGRSLGSNDDQIPLNSDLGDLAHLDNIGNADLEDDAVDTINILDAAITLAKLFGAPEGSVMYWDSSNRPQILTGPPGWGYLYMSGEPNNPPTWVLATELPEAPILAGDIKWWEMNDLQPEGPHHWRMHSWSGGIANTDISFNKAGTYRFSFGLKSLSTNSSLNTKYARLEFEINGVAQPLYTRTVNSNNETQYEVDLPVPAGGVVTLILTSPYANTYNIGGLTSMEISTDQAFQAGVIQGNDGFGAY